MLFKMKIREKLILSVCVAMMLVLSSLGYVGFHTFASSARVDKEQIAGLHLEVMVSNFVQLAANERLKLRALEQNIADGSDPEPLLKQYLRHTHFASGVLLADDRGVSRQAVGETTAVEGLLIGGAGTNIEPTSVGTSLVLPGSEPTELTDGRLLAAAQFSGVQLLRNIEYKNLPNHTVIVIANQGEPIVSNRGELGPEVEQEYRQFVSQQRFSHRLLDGDNWYAMHAKVPNLPAELWYLVPKSEFQSGLMELRNRVIVVTVILLLITFWIVLGISYRITLPICELTESIAAMKEDEYAVPLVFRDTGDETAELARSFESMRQHIDLLISVDPLTGLYNRRYLMRSFEIEINRSRRSHAPLCCMMFDIDHFKHINDTWGHPCGDYVLRQVAHIIKTNIRDCDIAARFGGEEFTVLLPTAGKAEALRVGQRIGAVLEAFEFIWEGDSFYVTTSGGIASLDDIDTDDPSELMKLADASLYEAKQGGRNRIVVNGVVETSETPRLDQSTTTDNVA